MSSFDIIIIGAGPAGSAAAVWAAKGGARVALIDKATFPRNKLCGGLFTERSRTYYQEIFGQDFDLSRAVTRTDIAFWHDGAELAVLNDVPPLHLTMRLDLDATLFGHALAAGAVNFSGRAISQITDKSVSFKDGETLDAPILIGADGVNSIVAKHLFGSAFDTQTIGFGLEIEVPSETQAPEQHPLRIDFGVATWGYGWSFPKRHSTTVGVGGLRAPNPDMKGHMRRYVETLGLDPDAIKFKGHHLPFGDFRPTPGRANILLAGDAAGLVDPITGEGIAFAMKSGQIAAQSALDALAANAPDTALVRHQKGLREIHKNLRIARTLRRIIFAPRWQGTFTRTFRRSGTVRVMYMRLLAGELEYPELARSVLARLPRYLLNRFRT
ncbi:geranylgeranyl reductase family protein [Shimia haliotis]|uniref:Geranylgeranyl reductase family n=1 Tax=Shimia haliotis TaxID=1280847 RepID=A0A1I4CVQ2_9RHOB|nr:geranylgeranyl reductase family protein [Shimia haliotis]SFK84975.1 geranylgeranyl reductase family [Shimia haliotis]